MNKVKKKRYNISQVIQNEVEVNSKGKEYPEGHLNIDDYGRLKVNCLRLKSIMTERGSEYET